MSVKSADLLHARQSGEVPIPMMRWFFIFVSAASLGLALGGSPQAAEGPQIDFGRDIHPILSDLCFQCHGPDAKSRQADLRLDTSEGATAGAAVRPGDSAASELVRRIFSDKPDEV